MELRDLLKRCAALSFFFCFLADVLCRFMDHAEFRLGRQSVDEVMSHPFFRGIRWDSVHQRQ